MLPVVEGATIFKSGLSTQNDSIRVAHILSGTHVWGVENYVHNLLSSAHGAELKPIVICTNEGIISSKFRNSNFEVVIVPIRNYFDIAAVVALVKILKVQQVQLVHLHLGLDSFVGAIAAKIANVPAIMSVHFDHPNWISYSRAKRVGWRELQKLKNKTISHFLPITKNVGLELTKRETVPPSKITVVHPGIPLFETNEDDRDSVRSEMGCAQDDIILIGIGRLEPEKNFASVVDAISKVDEKLKLKVWIVGDGSEKAELESRIKRLGMSHRIKLLGYRSDIPKLLSAADLFVLASKAEPFGMSAVEAMIAKLPVVATQGTGLGTIVDDKVTGELVPPDDPTSLAAAIERLVTDSKLRKTYAKAGRTRAEELFTSDGMSQKIINIYRMVLSNKQSI